MAISIGDECVWPFIMCSSEIKLTLRCMCLSHVFMLILNMHDYYHCVTDNQCYSVGIDSDVFDQAQAFTTASPSSGRAD